MMQELNYIRCGDYYIPDIRLPEETRPIIGDGCTGNILKNITLSALTTLFSAVNCGLIWWI